MLTCVLLGLEPLDDAVHVEGVVALAPDGRAGVARYGAVGAAGVEGHAADTAQVFFHVPPPGRNAMPLDYADAQRHRQQPRQYNVGRVGGPQPLLSEGHSLTFSSVSRS